MKQRTERYSLGQILHSILEEDVRVDDFRKNFSRNFYYYNLPLTEESFILEGKKPVKLKLLVTNYAPHTAALYIRYTDETRLVKSVKTEYLKRIINILTLNNIHPVKTYVRMNKSEHQWRQLTMKELYRASGAEKEAKTNGAYDCLHANILEEIVEITQILNLKKVLLVDGGCGDGRLLKKIEATIQAPDLDTQLLGFDFNPGNIDDCRNNYSGRCQFIQGNLLEVDVLLAAWRSAQDLDKAIPTFLILSGSLTRLVLKNGFQALTVLKKAYLGQVDILLGGGIGEPLLNDFIAKHIGYVPYKQVSGSHHFFLYRRLEDQEILSNKLNKMVKRNFLDLSLCPRPEFILKQLMGNIKDNMIIDLSFCDLSKELIHLLKTLIKQHKGINLIFWHWEELAMRIFNETFSALSINAVRQVISDSYLMSSRCFFSQVEEQMASKKILDMVKMAQRCLGNDHIEKENNIIEQVNHIIHQQESQHLMAVVQYNYILSALQYELQEVEVKETLGQIIAEYLVEASHLPGKGYEERAADLLVNVFVEQAMSIRIQSMEMMLEKGEFSVVPMLLYIYKTGFLVPALGKDNYAKVYVAGKNPEKEIRCYHALAQTDPQRFDPEKMKELSQFVIGKSQDMMAVFQMQQVFNELWNHQQTFRP